MSTTAVKYPTISSFSRAPRPAVSYLQPHRIHTFTLLYRRSHAVCLTPGDDGAEGGKKKKRRKKPPGSSRSGSGAVRGGGGLRIIDDREDTVMPDRKQVEKAWEDEEAEGVSDRSMPPFTFSYAFFDSSEENPRVILNIFYHTPVKSSPGNKSHPYFYAPRTLLKTIQKRSRLSLKTSLRKANVSSRARGPPWEA